MNVSIPQTFQDRLLDLGNIPLSRIQTSPAPGMATKEDWLVARKKKNHHCELVDGTLIEKPMGWIESLLSMLLGRWLGNYVAQHNLGIVTGPDGFTELYADTIRSPDIAFTSWSRMPEGKLPTEPVPHLVPNLVIEIVSQGNTYSEMSRKRREYFQAGVELVWMVEHQNRTITVYRSSQQYQTYSEGEQINGSPVIEGWSFNTAELFAVLDQQKPPHGTDV